MPLSKLIVAGSDDLQRQQRGQTLAYAQTLLEAWPREDAPEVQSIEHFSDLLELLRGPSLLDLHDEPEAVVIGWTGDEPMPLVAEVFDHLLRHQIPAVFLVERYGASWSRFEGRGLLVEPFDTDPVRMAAVMHSLLEQSSVIRELRDEVRAAHATHGGISGQISRLHEEMNLAAVIQRDLMPHEPPRVEGLEVGVLFRPAAYVSGDIFDLVKLPDGRLAFLLADAVGHGVPAALLTMLILRAVAERRDGGSGYADPAMAMQAINSALSTACPRGQRFATAVCGVIDPLTYEVRISVAGHPPPLRFCGRASRTIQGHGPLLGVFEDAEFGDERFTLEPGETLLLYSDGFETAFPSADNNPSPANQIYLQHFEAFGHAAEEPQRVVTAMRALEQVLDAQSGSLHQGDDITAIAIARPGIAATAYKAA